MPAQDQATPTRSDAQRPLSAEPETAPAQPSHVGRYRVERVLGKGGFGLVYLAHDDQLQRPIAIKVAHARLVADAADAEAHLIEARTVAKLDHPHIVPVYDVGTTEQFPCYVVSKYIDGTDLSTRLRQSRLTLHESVGLAATAAEALHYAHKQGLVHRDVKPGNVLLDRSGKCFVADFGLALREQDVGKGPRFAGTPAYMSPEQARGEGHRVDGRSDIFSLGVVLYEMLTGTRPFKADTVDEVLSQITGVEARPPRQIDDAIPKELERICLKALAKRASERYTTAKDMADDLRHYLAGSSIEEKSTLTGQGQLAADAATSVPSPPPTPSDQHVVRIVPKGLRSFDANDADFFLELLPGPRDRDGLPDTIRFWKSRIETMDAENTFAVGLIYGPSGCGKSSLMKAGLLPRLAGSGAGFPARPMQDGLGRPSHVISVYFEATAEETEARLLKGLRRQLPDLPSNFNLVESLAALRRGRFLASGQKVLLVLDQFEQWLHAKRTEENTELVQALRHCDGARVQCIVMVRDDFWLAVSRFMKAMEVEILEGKNSALVDLFDLLHARKVLAAFGSAFGRLPDNLGQCSKEQNAFLDQAVAGLAQDGKIISVRLALFAEMVKGKPWTPTTLREVGGTEGVGVTFLEETFTASTAPPQHRVHQKAAQAVLNALLPEAGTDIKGHMRSQQELLASSSYAGRPRDFAELLRILDSELRLITPTELVDEAASFVEPQQTKLAASSTDTRYYQLTHDYLVPSLRDWLTRKQKETRRGRAELLLADRAAVWKARPERRQLPSLLQWCQIRWHTATEKWTPPQRKMMRKAGRYHALRTLAVVVVLALLGWGSYETHGRLKAHALRDRLLDANTTDVPAIVDDMASYRRWVDPLLRDALQEAEAEREPRKQLHASLALLPVDAGQVDYLYSRLLDAAPHEVPVIRDALASHKDELLDRLWAVVEKPEKQRLRAAAALAKYDPESDRWVKVQDAIANDLVNVPAVYLAAWLDSLRPVREKLLVPLSDVYSNPARRDVERSLATDVLADYAADHPKTLADLLMNGDEKQFAVIYPKFKEQGERGIPILGAEIDKKLPPELPASDEGREKLAKRQANAAVALLRMNQPVKVWPLLKHSPDPRVRSYLIHRLAPLGADAAAIIQRLDDEPDTTIRRALLLSLGEFSEQDLPLAARQALLAKLQAMYRCDTDPGLHAATEWLLRRWKQEAWLKQVNEEWVKNKEQREKRLEGIQEQLKKDKQKTPPQWYVNGQGQTMVVIPAMDFTMGSPMTETGRSDDERQHLKRIRRPFAISAKSVTIEQILAMRRGYYGKGEAFVRKYAPTDDCPAITINWFMAAEYCNWLSDQEGIDKDQWCYEIKAGLTKLKDNYLSLTGYRLPTEAEMEYATRAGAVTSRYFGETEDLLPKYAWYVKNAKERPEPVGLLKPNDFGLFDVLGNVFTWCLEEYGSYPEGEEGSEDREHGLVIDRSLRRVLRGGSFVYLASNVRSAIRNDFVPAHLDTGNGFRPARTLSPGNFTALPPTP